MKYGYIHDERRFFFVLSVLDVYDRSLVHSHIGLTATAEEAAPAVGHAIWKRWLTGEGVKPVVRTDNGPQFIADAFESACERHGIEHERIPSRTPNKNAHIEAFHRILEDECLSMNEFSSFREAYTKVADFLDYYNTIRIHSSIGYLAPEDFYQATMSKTAIALLVRV